MNCRTFAKIVIAVSCASASGSAQDVVAIRLNEQRFMDPATVRLIVAVEPDARNQILRVDADSDDMYSATDVTLNGANEKRLHYVEFRNLQAGQYTLRAAVYSGKTLRGITTQKFLVTGAPIRAHHRAINFKSSQL